MKNLSSKYIGIITGAAMVLASLLMFYSLKIPAIGGGSKQYLVWAIYSIGIIVSLMMHKSQPGEHTFKEYFSEGFKTFIVAALIIVVYVFIFYKMNPQIMESMIAENNKLAMEAGQHTAPEIADNANGFRKMFVTGVVMTNTGIYLIIGALVSMIGGGFLAQKKFI